MRTNLHWSYTIAAAVVLVALVWILGPDIARASVDAYEDVTYAIHPSAAYAFEIGERHFDASNPSQYDIRRAQIFFNKAAALDPSYPYLYHELARISFLRGNFPLALSEIDLQIELHGDSEPNSYYVRGLIEGYMGDYTDAVNDFKTFLEYNPGNWAAENDEAWVLLKAGRYEEALAVTGAGLQTYPDNPWLLNSEATALSQLGYPLAALPVIQKASEDMSTITPQDWEIAYPGNDPAIAPDGLASFRQDVSDNMHSIQVAASSSAVQSK
jgi:tetratricopeptide (TPR) repeat protein